MSEPGTLFSGGLTFDGTSKPAGSQAVLMRGGKIAAVAPAAEFEGFEGQRIDTSGHTLLPGLIDTHVHLCLDCDADAVSSLKHASPADIALKILENAQAALAGGVTTLRDLGAPGWHVFSVRDAIQAGHHEGPKILAAGKVICITGGHGAWIGIEADGADEVRKAVRINVREGADCIKIIATGGVLTPNVDPLAAHLFDDEIAAAVETAKSLGRKTAAHAQGEAGIRKAIMGGVDSIEHGIQLTDEIIELMIRKDIYLVPTLSASRNLIREVEQLPPSVGEKILRFAEMHAESFTRFAKAGGRIAMGTDAGTPFNKHGQNSQELRHMVEFGLEPLDALRAATSEAARLLSLDDVGHIRPGARADLILIEGDPSEDIATVAEADRLKLVVKDGKEILLRRRPAGSPSSPTTRRTGAVLETSSFACCMGD